MTVQLKPGRTYRGRHPRNAGGLVNDRTVLYIGATHVQYDGPSVNVGHRYPSTPIEKFLEWADRDVTDELPAGEFAAWPIKRRDSGAS